MYKNFKCTWSWLLSSTKREDRRFLFFSNLSSWPYMHIPLIPALKSRCRKIGIQGHPLYIGSSEPAWTSWPCLKKENTQQQPHGMKLGPPRPREVRAVVTDLILGCPWSPYISRGIKPSMLVASPFLTAVIIPHLTALRNVPSTDLKKSPFGATGTCCQAWQPEFNP